jgi:VanZ family protein
VSDVPPTRLQLAAAASVTAVLITYASLGPLRMHVGLSIAWRVLAETWPPLIESKTDFFSNVLLQAPLGFLAAGAIAADRPKRRGIAVGLTALVCAALAVAIELAQVSIPSRTPQLVDVVAETIGGVAGAVCWTVAGDALLAIVRPWWRARGGPVPAALLIYVACWTLWQWLPFDFTVRPAEVAGKYRAGMIAFSPPREPPVIMLVTGVLACLAAVPIGLAALRALGDNTSRVRAVLASVAWVLAVAAGQTAVLSRATSLLSFVAASVGCALGVFLATTAVMPRLVR